MDVFTAVPLLLQGGAVRCWLSVTYLRSLGVLWAYERLQQQEGRLGGSLMGGDLGKRISTTAVRLATVVCCFAGSMFLLEYLGDIPHLHDVYLLSDMGDISFHQMCYFIVVTIATIGYGDFSPKTLLGRTLLLVIILGGVAFFTYEVNRLVSLRALQVSGKGTFRPARGRRSAAHVLVCGGALTNGSATLSDFLAELCHPLRAAGDEAAPQVVLLCEGEPTAALRRVLAKRFARHCTFLAGSPLVLKDLQRAKAGSADMALVLADLAAPDAAAEDEETVLAAAALHRLHPSLPLRVMLIRRDSKRLALTAALAFAPALCPVSATAGVIGFLGNFDVTNDTGKTAHGFEIDLEGLHIGDITDTFGGPGRGFPTGRGFGAGSVERYGSPTLSEYSSGAIFGTKVVYQGLFDGIQWDYGTPSGAFITPGDNCWSGGGLGYNASTPCDHFGVGVSKNASKTTYSWLTETAPNSGVLSNGVVNLPAPVWNVIPAAPPPPGQPPAPPVVVAMVQAPAPVQPPELPEPQWGTAIWVKVFTTELENAPKLEDLIGGNAALKNMKTETEWQLLQKDPGNPLSGVLESGYGAPVGPNAASILRR